jgi:hypothetical protein
MFYGTGNIGHAKPIDIEEYADNVTRALKSIPTEIVTTITTYDNGTKEIGNKTVTYDNGTKEIGNKTGTYRLQAMISPSNSAQ